VSRLTVLSECLLPISRPFLSSLTLFLVSFSLISSVVSFREHQSKPSSIRASVRAPFFTCGRLTGKPEVIRWKYD
jgi:hypothetical protein